MSGASKDASLFVLAKIKPLPVVPECAYTPGGTRRLVHLWILFLFVLFFSWFSRLSVIFSGLLASAHGFPPRRVVRRPPWSSSLSCACARSACEGCWEPWREASWASLEPFSFRWCCAAAFPPARCKSVLQIFVLLLMSYIGLVIGTSKGDLLNLGALGDLFNSERSAGKRNLKVLDTSAIIDGRIADMAETGFLEGSLVVPEFVLRELQMVADSQDGSKRQRGRRGLDVLQRMQGNSLLTIQIIQDDYPQIREVDLKLIELAKDIDAKIVTNDFNLNKVAHLHNVPCSISMTLPTHSSQSCFRAKR